MHILYVGKHGATDNQDEDAITFALTKLGHNVKAVSQSEAVTFIPHAIKHFSFDFLLFNNGWVQAPIMARRYGSRIPFVLWNFDMVSSSDKEWLSKSKLRREWMNSLIRFITVGFCTDGDWVARDTSGKLFHLMQGADERFVGYGNPTKQMPDILFVGGSTLGAKRKKCLSFLKSTYGDSFGMIGDGPTRVHGRELADTLASTKITVAPDGPVTDLYWSNRVYLLLGLGGFLIHPYCQKLLDHYSPNELTYYNNHDELRILIDYYLSNPELREMKRKAGHAKTLESNLYRHRCEVLIEKAKEFV